MFLDYTHNHPPLFKFPETKNSNFSASGSPALQAPETV